MYDNFNNYDGATNKLIGFLKYDIQFFLKTCNFDFRRLLFLRPYCFKIWKEFVNN